MERSRNIFLSALTIAALIGACVCVPQAFADSTGKGATFPGDLFVKTAPGNALGVGEARKSAEEGKPIVIKGIIGGIARPISDKSAMFLVVDPSIGNCKDGCADFCHVPKDQLMANMATIQIVDAAGKPLKTSVAGVNGLQPLSQVVIRGTVAKRDAKFLVVNANNIFVEAAAK